ncbi:hypothetical protein Cgig2_014341 [Carnegiea gigantea]|uniref:DUF4283 domain-containing protein n=1 Tax=Carnegiea gigantea TaxID=171969 RepID=A0A9Q1GHL1_9CARY|nr:hypothetical protein Cgig2_014341 [Carnegiea gigantea]
MGANPPCPVMDGFTKRLWEAQRLDKMLGMWIKHVNEEDIASIPIWVQLYKLDMRFWNSQGPHKIGSLPGKPLATNKATQEKGMLKYAKILVEMRSNGHFSETITFVGEKCMVIKQPVEFEWNPLKCPKFHVFGHLVDEIRKDKKTKEWRKKGVQLATIPEIVGPQDNAQDKG